MTADELASELLLRKSHLLQNFCYAKAAYQRADLSFRFIGGRIYLFASLMKKCE
jgi:hypothetical protein